MIATYCFSERQQELFTEALMRGLHAAMCDWPRLTRTPADAALACAHLRLETCCVDDEMAYRSLTESAWESVYLGYGGAASERLLFTCAHMRVLPLEEGLALMRPFLTKPAALAEAEQMYVQYQEAIRRSAAAPE